MDAVSIVVILVLAALMGVTVGSYQGQSVSQMFQTAQANLYTVDSSVFDVTAQDYINSPEWQNAYITGSDIQQAERQASDKGFVYNWLRDSMGLGTALYDAFNDDWSASVDSRTINVVGTDGEKVGSTFLIGVVPSSIRYADRVSVRPDLIAPSNGRGVLLFESISADGNYYHTDFDGIILSNNSTIHVYGRY